MHFFTAFLLGFGISLIGSIPLGPISLSVVQATLEKGRRAGLLTGAGGTVVEMGFCFISLFGYHLIADQHWFLILLQLLTVPVLLYMGITTIRQRFQNTSTEFEQCKDSRQLMTGATLAFSNPALFGWWFYVTAYLQSQTWLESSAGDYIMFVLGVATGTFLFFIGLVQVAMVSHAKLSSKGRRKVNLVIGVLFIGFAIFLGLRSGLEILGPS